MAHTSEVGAVVPGGDVLLSFARQNEHLPLWFDVQGENPTSYPNRVQFHLSEDGYLYPCKVGEFPFRACRLAQGKVDRLEDSVLNEEDVADNLLVAFRKREGQNSFVVDCSELLHRAL